MHVLIATLSPNQKKALLLTLRQLQKLRAACLIASQAGLALAGSLYIGGHLLVALASICASLALVLLYVMLAPETYYFWWDMDPSELDPRA